MTHGLWWLGGRAATGGGEPSPRARSRLVFLVLTGLFLYPPIGNQLRAQSDTAPGTDLAVQAVAAEQQPGKPPAGGPADLPSPRPIPGGPQTPSLLPLLGGQPSGCAAPRMEDPAVREKVKKFVQSFIDPETSLDVIVNQTRVMNLKAPPRRIQVADERVLSYNLVTPTELLLQGKEVGNTVLNLWFGDPADPANQETLSYLVRVLPDPEYKERLERAYRALEEQVNRFFCDSCIRITLLGDKLVLSGRVKDMVQGMQILRIVRANAPGARGGAGSVASTIPVERINLNIDADVLRTDGLPPVTLENFLTAGGPNIVNLLEVPGEQQVMLRVIVAEINRAAARSIGLNFSIINNQGVTVFSNNTGPIIPQAGLGVGQNAGGVAGAAAAGGAAAGTSSFNSGGAVANITAALDNGQIPLLINALRTLSYAKSLAEPTLVTLNGQTANFQAGGQFPVPIVTGNTFNGLQGVAFVPFGVQLSFTPFITDIDRIRLAVTANVSSRNLATGTNIGGSTVSGLTTRNFSTTVELRQGETMAVAGLLQTNVGADSTRVPFIGELPFVGPLTGLTRLESGEQELVILITPELAHPMQPKQVPPLPGSELFEPNDWEFYLLGRIESHRPVDFRAPIRTDLSRIKQYHELEQQNICGPTGYSTVP